MKTVKDYLGRCTWTDEVRSKYPAAVFNEEGMKHTLRTRAWVGETQVGEFAIAHAQSLQDTNPGRGWVL